MLTPAVMERVDAVIESVPPSSATYTLRLLAHADDQRQVRGWATAGWDAAVPRVECCRATAPAVVLIKRPSSMAVLQ